MLLQVDAQSYTRLDDDIERIDYVTMFYKAVKMVLFDPERSVRVGIRTTIENLLDFHIIDAPEVHKKGTAFTIDRIKDIFSDNKYYVKKNEEITKEVRIGTKQKTKLAGGLCK